jgi:hypothetical protein
MLKVDTTLLAVLSAYGAVGGVLGAATARWMMKNFYAFRRPHRLRYAFGAAQFGGAAGWILTAGVTVALHLSDPSDFAGAVGLTVASLIALIQGAPKETGLALPHEFREAMREAENTYDRPLRVRRLHQSLIRVPTDQASSCPQSKL